MIDWWVQAISIFAMTIGLTSVQFAHRKNILLVQMLSKMPVSVR